MDNYYVSNTDRQIQILEQIQIRHRLNISDICSMFDVSEATARRDLDTLGAEKKIQRVHGGAIALKLAPPELPILQRQDEQAQEKLRIGQAAAALINDGDTIFLTSGTTVLEAAKLLKNRKNLTVITNSLPVINTLAGVEGLTVICLGGMLRESELSFIGHITEQALEEVRADKVLIGARAISLEVGLTNDYMPETMTDRNILKISKQILVLADHTKFGRSATVLLAPLETIDTIITDDQTPFDFLTEVKNRGIKVIIA